MLIVLTVLAVCCLFVQAPVVFASNVSPDTNEGRLHKHFSQFGTVTRVVIIRTRQKNVLNAEVYFDKWAHANRAVRTITGAHLVSWDESIQFLCIIIPYISIYLLTGNPNQTKTHWQS